jgi:O-antigen/teichoic acid export membrane protein
VAGILAGLAFGADFLRVVYRPEYAQYSSILVLAMVAATINYLAEFTGSALAAIRAFRVQPVVVTVCTILGWMLCVAAIPRHGIVGAAWAVVLIGSCQLMLYGTALTYILLRRSPGGAQR